MSSQCQRGPLRRVQTWVWASALEKVQSWLSISWGVTGRRLLPGRAPNPGRVRARTSWLTLQARRVKGSLRLAPLDQFHGLRMRRAVTVRPQSRAPRVAQVAYPAGVEPIWALTGKRAVARKISWEPMLRRRCCASTSQSTKNAPGISCCPVRNICGMAPIAPIARPSSQAISTTGISGRAKGWAMNDQVA